jgi:hypothetical protein
MKILSNSFARAKLFGMNIILLVLIIHMVLFVNAQTLSQDTIINQDGFSNSGTIWSNPITNPVMEEYSNWPDGFKNSHYNFFGGLYDGTYIWYVPFNANMVVRVNPKTGEMKGYNNWPTGFDASLEEKFTGGIIDGDNVWLIPYASEMLIKINTETGAMTGYNSWPSGFSGVKKFGGAIFDGNNIWLVPYTANMVVKVNPETGEMTGYNTWPDSFTKSARAFSGAAYDGINLWMIPYSADRVIKVDLSTGVMTGYANWPEGFTKGEDAFEGGVFDGTNIWMMPFDANMVIKMNVSTGAMTGYNKWPENYKDFANRFSGGTFDGKNIWMTPYNSNVVIKIDTATDVMTGYNNWPRSNFDDYSAKFSGGVFDGANLWFIPMGADRLIKMRNRNESELSSSLKNVNEDILKDYSVSVSNDTIQQEMDSVLKQIDALPQDEITKPSLVIDLRSEKESDLNMVFSGSKLNEIARENLSIQVDTKDISFQINSNVLSNDILIHEPKEVILIKSVGDVKKVEEALNNNLHDNPSAKVIGEVRNFDLLIKDKKDKLHKIKSFSDQISVDIKLSNYELSKIKNPKKTAVYYLSEDGKYEYAGGFIDNDTIKFKTNHFSYYIVMENNSTFSDIYSSFAKEEIEILSSRNIIKGYNNKFEPKGTINRAQFSTLISRAICIPPQKYSVVFKDVTEESIFAGYVLGSYKKGIMKGEGEFFRPFENIRREQIATVLINAQLLLGQSKVNSITTETNIDALYVDSNKISSYARNSVQLVSALGFMQGYNKKFNPDSYLSREEATIVLYNFMLKNNLL